MKPDLDYIAILVKLDLLEQFGDRYRFDPVIAERRDAYEFHEEDHYTIWVGYAPRNPMRDDEPVNSISMRALDRLDRMGVASVDTYFRPADKVGMPRKSVSDKYSDDWWTVRHDGRTPDPTDHRLIPWAEIEPDLDYIAALVKLDLMEQFGDRYKFDPVIAERRLSFGYDETNEYYAVWVGYSGCSKSPDAKILNGVSDRISKDLYKMGLTYVSTRLVPADKFELAREMEGDGTR